MLKIYDASTFLGKFSFTAFLQEIPILFRPKDQENNLKNPPAEDNSCLFHDEELQRNTPGHYKDQGGLHTNLTVPYISWLLLLDEYKWIWNHTKSWERQREEWVMETLPCGGRISLAAWAPPSPQALPAAGCAARRDNVHRCAALNWAAYKGPWGSTWKLGMFWCYSSPCHMKHPPSFQQRLTRHKKCIWKNQILVLLLLWCVKAYSSQKELYLCNSGTPNGISGTQRAMRKGDCVDAMYEWFLSLLLMKSQGRGF